MKERITHFSKGLSDIQALAQRRSVPPKPLSRRPWRESHPTKEESSSSLRQSPGSAWSPPGNAWSPVRNAWSPPGKTWSPSGSTWSPGPRFAMSRHFAAVLACTERLGINLRSASSAVGQRMIASVTQGHKWEKWLETWSLHQKLMHIRSDGQSEHRTRASQKATKFHCTEMG